MTIVRFFCILCLVTSAICFYINYNNKHTYTAQAEGHFVRYADHEYDDMRDTKHVNYIPIIEYEAPDGSMVVFQDHVVDEKTLEKGQVVEVRYNPEDYSEALSQHALNQNRGIDWFTLCMGLVFLVVDRELVRAKRRKMC